MFYFFAQLQPSSAPPPMFDGKYFSNDALSQNYYSDDALTERYYSE